MGSEMCIRDRYYSPLGTAVTTTISNSEVINAGRFSDGNFWFMATDKAGSNISYQSSNGQRTYGVITGSTSYYSSRDHYAGLDGDYQEGYSPFITGVSWQKAITDAGYSFINCMGLNLSTCLSNNSTNLDDIGIIVISALGTTSFGYTYSELADWIDGGGNLYHTVWEHSGGCCYSTQNMTQAQGIFSALGWSGLSGGSSTNEVDVTITQSVIDDITDNGGTLDYSGILNDVWNPAMTGVLNNASVCDPLAGSALFICDPGRTGSSGAVMGSADVNAFTDFITSDNLSLIHI